MDHPVSIEQYSIRFLESESDNQYSGNSKLESAFRMQFSFQSCLNYGSSASEKESNRTAAVPPHLRILMNTSEYLRLRHSKASNKAPPRKDDFTPEQVACASHSSLFCPIYQYFSFQKQYTLSKKQYEASEEFQPPKFAILRAVVLFIIGSILIVSGVLLFTGHLEEKVRKQVLNRKKSLNIMHRKTGFFTDFPITRRQYADRTWPVLVLGVLTFVPGFYYSRIAYYAYRRYPGYSFLQIPADG